MPNNGNFGKKGRHFISIFVMPRLSSSRRWEITSTGEKLKFLPCIITDKKTYASQKYILKNLHERSISEEGYATGT